MTLLAIGGPVVLAAAVFALGWHLIDNNLRRPHLNLRPVLDLITQAGAHRAGPQHQHRRGGWKWIRATWAARTRRTARPLPPAVSEEDLHWEDDAPQQPGGEQPEGHDDPGPLFSEWKWQTDSGIMRAIEVRP